MGRWPCLVLYRGRFGTGGSLTTSGRKRVGFVESLAAGPVIWRRARRDVNAILPGVDFSGAAVDMLGVSFPLLDPDSAVDVAERLYLSEVPAWVAVENVHALNLAFADPLHRQVLARADLVLNDGKGVMLGARLLGRRFPADLNGNFFTPLLLERAAERGWPVFFLGAAPGVAHSAAAKLSARDSRLNIVGVRDGFFSLGEEETVVEEIRAAEAGLLLVGMGMPRQEQWLDSHLEATGARLGCTVGAFFDFQAGVIPRAPRWMNRMGIEWVYRLLKEPRRLWRRYLMGNPLFVLRVLRQRWS